MSFHHGYLGANEYHFKDFEGSVTYRTIDDSYEAKVKLIVTSHHLFVDFLGRNEKLIRGNRNQCSLSPLLLKISYSSVENVNLSTNGSLKEEVTIQSNNVAEYRMLEETIVHDRVLISITNVGADFFSLFNNMKVICGGDEDGNQLDSAILKHELMSIETVLKHLNTKNISTAYHSTVFMVGLYFRDRGMILLGDDGLFFFSFRSPLSDFVQVEQDTIVKVEKKPWRMHKTALEVYYGGVTPGSIFMAFSSAKERDVFYDKLSGLSSVKQNSFSLEDCTKQWSEKLLTNYEYLMILNERSGRTFHDICQYPIFPWVLKEFESCKIDISHSKFYRDLSVSIKEKSNLGCLLHADNVARYLGKKHRMLFSSTDPFVGLNKEWNLAKNSTTTINEVTPEFYRDAEFYGSCKEDQYPKWATNSREVMLIMRASLESSVVNKTIHRWIDNTFGVGQRSNDVYVEDPIIIKKPNGLLFLSSNPEPLFSKRHPPRESSNTVNSNFDQTRTLKQQYEIDVVKKDELINNLRQIVQVLEQKLDRKSTGEIPTSQNSIDIPKGNFLMNDSSPEDAVPSLEKEDRIREQQQMIDELADQLLNSQLKYSELEEKYNTQVLARSRLRGKTPVAKWESMFNELTGKYDQLYKSYKCTVEERNGLKQKNKDALSSLSSAEKQMTREVGALESKLQQTLKEKLAIYDKQLELENKYNQLQTDYRQLRINMHFLEQKVRDDTKIREKTQSLLSEATHRIPTSIGIYGKQEGEIDFDVRSLNDTLLSPPEKISPFIRNKRPVVNRSFSSVDDLEPSELDLSVRSSSPTSRISNKSRYSEPSTLSRSPIRTTSPTITRSPTQRTGSPSNGVRRPATSPGINSKTLVSSSKKHSIASLPKTQSNAKGARSPILK